jgi:DNA polymerase III delta prime subunit
LALGLSPQQADDLFDFSPSNPRNLEVASMTEAGLIDSLRSHLAGKGLYYPDWLLLDAYLALKSKPFVILAGLSGSGKTRLALELAEALGENGIVPVRPSWDDARDLFGHRDVMTGTFSPTAAFETVRAAAASPKAAVTLILDEMNLAHVEHYFADVLSVLESRSAGSAASAQFTVAAAHGAKAAETVTWRRNVFLMGTVNVDESTKGISPKVLGRANVLEFPVPSPKQALTTVSGRAKPWAPAQRAQLGEILATAKVPSELIRDGTGAIKGRLLPTLDKIDQLHAILAGAGLGVTMRVAYEILAFVEHGLALLEEAKALGITFIGPSGASLDETALCDLQWHQRILPHVAGPQDMLEGTLDSLEKWFKANGYSESEKRTARLRKMHFVHFWGSW